MKLKEIKPGMVIWCRTEEEANQLFFYLRNNGVTWSSGAALKETDYYTVDCINGVGYLFKERDKLEIARFGYYVENAKYYEQIVPFSLLVVEEKTYEDGLNEAWGLYNKIYEMSYETRNKVFGVNSYNNGVTSIYKKFTPQEVVTKLAEYEAKQFTAGDVVQEKDTFCKVVVTRAEEDTLYIVYADGSTGAWEPDDCVKTGQKVDLTALFSVFEEKDKCLL